MTTIYTFDTARIYSGVVECDPFGPVPPGALVAPPTLTPPQVAQWRGNGWVVLSAYPAPPAVDLAVLIKAAIAKIDVDADKIYGDVVGNKGEEYRTAEADAKAFVAAGYTGTAGSGVTSWATAKGWTTTQAANDIIAQATAWRGAQALIRAQRLGKKEAVKAATDSAAIDALMGQWAAFVTGIRTQLGVS